MDTVLYFALSEDEFGGDECQLSATFIEAEKYVNTVIGRYRGLVIPMIVENLLTSEVFVVLTEERFGGGVGKVRGFATDDEARVYVSSIDDRESIIVNYKIY